MKKLKHLILICSTCLTISTSNYVDAFESKQQGTLIKIKSQLKRINWHTIHDNKWAYTVETKLEKGKKIQQTKQRFDPSKPRVEQWQLLQSDFEEPTPARLSHYKDTQLEIAEEVEQQYTENIEIIDFNTLSFIEQKEQLQMFKFTPKLPMFSDEVNQLFKGVLYFDGQTQQITKLLIEAQESFSPRISFTIDSYLLNIEIEKLDDQLHVISINSVKSGEAFWFTDFDEKSSRILSNFKKVK